MKILIFGKNDFIKNHLVNKLKETYEILNYETFIKNYNTKICDLVISFEKNDLLIDYCIEYKIKLIFIKNFFDEIDISKIKSLKDFLIFNHLNIASPEINSNLIRYYKLAKNNQNIIVNNDKGYFDRDVYLDVRDFCEILSKMIKHNFSGIFNIGNRKNYLGLDFLANKIINFLNSSSDIVYTNVKENKVNIENLLFLGKSFNKVNNFNFEPEYDMNEILKYLKNFIN